MVMPKILLRQQPAELTLVECLSKMVSVALQVVYQGGINALVGIAIILRAHVCFQTEQQELVADLVLHVLPIHNA